MIFIVNFNFCKCLDQDLKKSSKLVMEYIAIFMKFEGACFKILSLIRIFDKKY